MHCHLLDEYTLTVKASKYLCAKVAKRIFSHFSFHRDFVTIISCNFSNCILKALISCVWGQLHGLQRFAITSIQRSTPLAAENVGVNKF